MDDTFTNGEPNSKKYVSETSFENNRNLQRKMVAPTVVQLRRFAVSSEKEKQLEYFFYSNAIEKATCLVIELKNRSYTVYDENPTESRGLFSIIGLTTKMKMSDEVLRQWVKEMCEIGYTFDCEFDGWGTLIEK